MWHDRLAKLSNYTRVIRPLCQEKNNPYVELYDCSNGEQNTRASALLRRRDVTWRNCPPIFAPERKHKVILEDKICLLQFTKSSYVFT